MMTQPLPWAAYCDVQTFLDIQPKPPRHNSSQVVFRFDFDNLKSDLKSSTPLHTGKKTNPNLFFY